MLGRPWMEESRRGQNGPLPTLAIVTVGQWLRSLDGLEGSEELVAKVRQNDRSALAELNALHLLRTFGNADVELFPVVPASGKPARQADLRARYAGSPWVVVEVARPDMSELEKRARAISDALACFVDSIEKPFALEVFLRREPSSEEVAAITEKIPRICEAIAPAREDLPGNLGFLQLYDTPAGVVSTPDHSGEELLPRIGVARARISIGAHHAPSRQISVRMAFADARAEEFLRSESRQLPQSAPGLIMVDLHQVPGGFQSWEPLLRRRFQPSIHTRVSGVCLFASSICSTPSGLASMTQTKLLRNPQAKMPLPDWLITALDVAGDDYRKQSALPNLSRPASR
jgi:hypothetical protein